MLSRRQNTLICNKNRHIYQLFPPFFEIVGNDRLSFSSYYAPGFVPQHGEKQTCNKHWRPPPNVIQMAKRSLMNQQAHPGFWKWRTADQCQTNPIGAFQGSGALKCHYDKKVIPFFRSDFESVFAWHLTGKVLSFEFYPKAVNFECKFWISRSAITHIQNWSIRPQRVGSRENDIINSLA